MIMETASFTGFIKTLFWLILAYYVVKFLIKMFAPVLLQQVVKKAEQNFQQQQQQYSQQQQQAYTAPKQEMPKEKKKVGEYIDYEEIE
ncbi:DUF4834 domain-containing protein [Flavobacterium cerinum]|nr:DUF4834 domain-containing protein [Flavobacterium cerinum]